MAEAATVPVNRARTWLLILGSLALLIIIAGMAALVLVQNKRLASFEAYGYAPQQETPELAASQAAEPVRVSARATGDAGKNAFTSLETFTANLAENDRDRFAQIGIVIETDPKATKALDAVLPPVRSEVLMLLTTKSAGELLSPKGKQALSAQVVDIARKYIAPEFRHVVYAAHFSSFVIQ